MISNTYFSNDPTSNPLNAASHAVARKLGRINRGSSKDPSHLEVPNQDVPLFGSPEWNSMYGSTQNKLVPPNQDIPLGDQLKGSGFLPGSDSIFKTSDGVVLDFKTRKVLFDPHTNNKAHWGNPNEVISFGMTTAYESPRREFEELIAKSFDSNGAIDHIAVDDQMYTNQIDPKSAQYWIQAEKEAAKLVSSMSDKQKKMISDFESHFPMSRLIEESMKSRV